jgi:beta-galactosidase
MHTLCITMRDKIHLKGFVFTRQSRAWLEQSALDADSVYGDSFTRTESGVMGIGNNVSLDYENMDFGTAERAVLAIDGCTPLEENPITIRFTREDGQTLTTLAQFRGTERGWQEFAIDVLPGVCSVTFVFLPGCQFDFYAFRFRQE